MTRSSPARSSLGSLRFPCRLTVRVRLDNDPRYLGSIHDDAIARARGFRAALVPGAFVYGHVGRLALQAWDMAWIERGALSVRFRRPVYNGDCLTISAGDLTGTPDMRRAEIRVINHEDEEVAQGWVGLPDVPMPPPDVSGFAVRPRPARPPAIGPGELCPGAALTTAGKILTEVDFRTSLAAFGESHPLHTDRGFVHSGCLMRLAMADTSHSFQFAAPVVLVAVEAQHFAPVVAGQRLTTKGQVSAAYLRKGRHYFDSQEFLCADGTLAAAYHRTMIYGEV